MWRYCGWGPRSHFWFCCQDIWEGHLATWTWASNLEKEEAFKFTNGCKIWIDRFLFLCISLYYLSTQYTLSKHMANAQLHLKQ